VHYFERMTQPLPIQRYMSHGLLSIGRDPQRAAEVLGVFAAVEAARAPAELREP
jgi:hypothetical protein